MVAHYGLANGRRSRTCLLPRCGTSSPMIAARDLLCTVLVGTIALTYYRSFALAAAVASHWLRSPRRFPIRVF